MFLKDYIEEKVYIKQQNRFYRFIIFILLVALIVNSFLTYIAFRYERTILVPVGLSETVSFSEVNPDDRYMVEMVKYVTYLALSYTPSTVDHQFASLLSLFTPDRYPVYRGVFDRIKESVKMAGVSSSFQVTDVKINRTARKILVTGVLQQWTQDKKFVNDESRHYIIEYTFNHGKFMLREFQECKQNCSIQEGRS